MKTIFTEKDLAFKSDSPEELIEMALEYLEPGKPGQRNELTKMVQKCRKEGMQKAQKSAFIAVYDGKRDEFCLFIKDEYEPAFALSMLFDLLTEFFFGGKLAEELQIRTQQIESYLTMIEKNEDLSLAEERAFLINQTSQLLEMLSLYQDDDQMSDEELGRLSDKIDLTFYKPIGDVLQKIMESLISGNMECDVDMGDFPLSDDI